MKKSFFTSIKQVIFFLFSFAIFLSLLPLHNTAFAASGLSAGWGFNETNGAVASDASGHSNTATLTNNPTHVSGQTNYGNALSFDGINDYLVIPNSSSTDISGKAFTLSLWMKPQVVQGDAVVLGKFWKNTMTSPFYQYGLELQGNGSTPVFQIGASSGVKTASMQSTLPHNQWSHLAITFNGTKVKFYLNGDLVKTKNLSGKIVARGKAMRISADANTQQFYKGILDDVRIYNRVLTQSEIQGDMTTPLDVATPTPTPDVPSPTPSCDLPNYPNGSCTGVPAGTTLEAQPMVDGLLTITTPNTVIEGKNIVGCVIIKAPNVTIRNSKITDTGDCFTVVNSFVAPDGGYNGGGLLLEDVEIDCNDYNHTAVGNYGVTARRVNIHSCRTGFDVSTDVVVTDSYLHDLFAGDTVTMEGFKLGGRYVDPTVPNEELQWVSSASNVTISHNTIFVHGTSTLRNNANGDTNILVEKNLFAGGDYGLYCPREGSTNMRVLNNHFSRIFYATSGVNSPWLYCDENENNGRVAELSGNVWDDTGELLSGQVTPTPPVTPTPTQTPTPTPDVPTPTCSSDFPDSSCTGVLSGTTLETQPMVDGLLIITTPNTVIEGKNIIGCVIIKAPNVTIRNSKITDNGDCFYVVNSFVAADGGYDGGGLLLQDVEIDCGDRLHTGVGSYGVTARRVDLHGCENGFSIGNDFIVEDSYIHDLYDDGSQAHTDGIQFGGHFNESSELVDGAANVIIRHNAIDGYPGTSAIISNPNGDTNIQIENNLLMGGSYSLYCARDSSTNVKVINNHFSRVHFANGGAFGPWTDCENASEVHGNVWDDTGLPVAFYDGTLQ